MPPVLLSLRIDRIAALACAFGFAISSLAACGGGAIGSADAGDPADAGTPRDTDAGPVWSNDTAAQLQTFWTTNGGRDSFPASYVDAVEALLWVEDAVERGEIAAARARIDATFAAYPPSDPVWWSGVDQAGANVGTPVAYYGLRMLDEITAVGSGPVAGEPNTITLTIVMPRCAAGQRPTSHDLSEGEAVDLVMDPKLAADDYFVIRQSLRIFQHYVWAITQGALRLEPRFAPVAGCVTVGFRADPAYAGIDDADAAIDQVPIDVQDQTDMWWVLYPSDVPSDPVFDDVAFITGGMGGRGRAPVFIIDDLWLTRKPPHLGRGPYTDVERRVYLPQWLQHEFFHHLFRTWPDFGLEAQGHQWFDRSTWPDDFVGEWEPDYYAEALRKRLYAASPSIASALQVALPGFDASVLLAEDFVGAYERRPVENDWHRVEIALEGDGLVWRNAAGAAWPLSWADGKLESDPTSPYGRQTLAIEPERDAAGMPLPAVRALFFNDEAHLRL